MLAYCLMCNHVHLLVEVTPRPAGPMTDDGLLRRYRAMLLIEGVGKFQEVSDERTGELRLKLERRGMTKAEVDAEMGRLEAGRGVAIAKRLRWRLRYLADGAVIGQQSSVDEVFRQCRGQFGPRRKDGARRMRGDAADLTKTSGLWSLRDLGSAG